MFRDFIDQVGVGTLSVAFGVPKITIYSWHRRNKIPRSRWDKLMELNSKLTYAQLRNMEIESSAQTEEAK